MDFTTFSISSSEDAPLSFFGKKTSWMDKQEIFGSKVSSSDEISSLQGFHIGDLVWGKVQSHPWWPGVIFNEAFAEPTILATRSKGHVLVAFFGDNSYGWFEPAELLPFSPYFLKKSKQGTSKTFLDAIEEAVDEERRRAALGLCCMCRNPKGFRAIDVPRYFEVDVPGYDPKGRYSIEQIERARDDFVPKESLSFLHGLAMMPTSVDPTDIGWIKRSAVLLAFRKAVYEEYDDTYAQAFGQTPIRPSYDDSEQEQNKVAPKVAPLPLPKTEASSTSSTKKRKRFSCSRKKGKVELTASTASKKRMHDKDVEEKEEGLRRKKKKKQIAHDSQSPPELELKKHGMLQREPSARTTSAAATGTSLLPTLPIVASEPQHSKPSSCTPLPTTKKAKQKLVKLDVIYKRLDDQCSSKNNQQQELLLKEKENKLESSSKHDQNEELLLKKKENKLESSSKHDQNVELLLKKNKENKLESSSKHDQNVELLLKKNKESKLESSSKHDQNEELLLKKNKESKLESSSKHDQNEELLLKKKEENKLESSSKHDQPEELLMKKKENDKLAPVLNLLPTEMKMQQKKKNAKHDQHEELSVKKKKELAPVLNLLPTEKKMQQKKNAKAPLAAVLPSTSSSPPALGSTQELHAMTQMQQPLDQPSSKHDQHEELLQKKKKKGENKLDPPIEKKIQQKKNAKAPTTTTVTQTTPKFPKAPPAVVLPSTSSSSPSAAAAAAAVAPLSSTLPPQPPLKESPTNLLLRFLPSFGLPSHSELKARFASFERLNDDQLFVNWSKHTCRVQFRFHQNALEAYNYAKGTDLFRRGKVTYGIFDVDERPTPSLQPDPRMLMPPPAPRPRTLMPPPVLNQGTSLNCNKTMLMPPPTQNLQRPLKSILKKPKAQSSAPPPATSQPPLPPRPPRSTVLRGAHGVGSSSNNNNTDTFSRQCLGLMTQIKEVVLRLGKFPEYSWHAANIALYDAHGEKKK